MERQQLQQPTLYNTEQHHPDAHPHSHHNYNPTQNHIYHTRPITIADFVKKPFSIKIDAPDTTVSATFELDKSIGFIRGILLDSNREDLMYYRGTQKIEINRLEISPEGYSTKNFMCSINCSPNVRSYDLGRLPVGNGQIKIDYKDTSDSRAIFEPYTVTINLDCELKK